METDGRRLGHSSFVFGICFGIRISSFGFFLALPAFFLPGALANEPDPKSPRELFNGGTALLQAGKLREAESALQAAVASQRETLQPPALYNLGHVRFGQGNEALKEAAKPEAMRKRASGALASGDQALAGIRAAQTSSDAEAIVSAYLQGRGARRELKSAITAVTKALESYSTVLTRWNRSSGDFKSAHELQPARNDAQFNADIVDQHIARLVDQVNEMQQQQQGMSDQRDQLKQMMQQLKGKLPGGQPPPGEGDGDDEDEDGTKPDQGMGEKQPPSRDGKEQQISPEDAMRLLETLKLDSNRKLPLGDMKTGDPKSKSGKTW